MANSIVLNLQTGEQSTVEISVDEIAAQQALHQKIIDSISYAEHRQREYPSIGDQLDALFHAGVFPEDMAAKIQAVKDKYPKEGA